MSITANLAGDRIRATLKQSFGNIKFHVRPYDRARVHIYVISWTDGPSEDAVQSLARRTEIESQGARPMPREFNGRVWIVIIVIIGLLAWIMLIG
jgi:hypothetical protein